MNKKNILQNLLRRALTPAGTNMTRWAMAMAVVMISLLAPTTEAWADGEEPQQSKPTYQLTSDDGIVHFFLKEGYKMTEVTEAPEGATIVVSPDFDMIPAGKYQRWPVYDARHGRDRISRAGSTRGVHHLPQ